MGGDGRWWGGLVEGEGGFGWVLGEIEGHHSLKLSASPCSTAAVGRQTTRLDESQREVGRGGGAFLGHVTPNDQFQTTSDAVWILKESSVACDLGILDISKRKLHQPAMKKTF